ncbi:hypothetical protein SAMN06265365_11462 [Tistlia consotensis]|uniref:Uncharacterized protein n=1 Tax=Tistlia consotensis USBA 355 TaxID=560819 RepID=A0A1Y6B9G6_9PROT|nr:hypothetical protein [Tistlia consotensis]SME99913.1 hypothetical protein SAMN05428998_102301 [Tistlia consotensis USBA 355]SNR76555.1 hypothetical protein SAMN06265365_11462 [Tistlia consotensis]
MPDGRSRGRAAEDLGGGRPAASAAADWLCLAATPTFAVLALAGLLGGGRPDGLCAAGQHGAGPGGMATMYLLMGLFHSAPWLRRVTRRRAPEAHGGRGLAERDAGSPAAAVRFRSAARGERGSDERCASQRADVT